MKKSRVNRLALFLAPAVILAFAGCVNRYTVEQWDSEPVIKVLVAENVSSVIIEANGNHTVSSGSVSVPVIGTAGRWEINSAEGISAVLNSTEHLTNPELPIKVAPDERTLLKLNGSPYRGWIAVTPGTSSGFNVINMLPLEQYLYGVVPREIGAGTQDIMTAIEAQAICARSYAISRFGSHRRQGFDIYGDTRDQAYSGMARESRYCTEAVNNTRGMVAFSGDELLDARYSSTCGGRTANSEDVWSTAIPYLRSTRDAPCIGAPYCASSPHYTWEKVIPAPQFYSTIYNAIPSGVTIRSWSLDINRQSKRVVKMVVNTNGGNFDIRGSTLRSAFSLKSTYFTIRERGEEIIFDGHGWGHGVGMCQYGAMEMSRRGKSARQILRHYYKDAWVGRLYD